MIDKLLPLTPVTLHKIQNIIISVSSKIICAVGKCLWWIDILIYFIYCTASFYTCSAPSPVSGTRLPGESRTCHLPPNCVDDQCGTRDSATWSRNWHREREVIISHAFIREFISQSASYVEFFLKVSLWIWFWKLADRCFCTFPTCVTKLNKSLGNHHSIHT